MYDDSGYDTSDPKHPDYADRMSGMSDHARKASREGSGIPGVVAVRDGGIDVRGVAIPVPLSAEDETIRFLLDGLDVDNLDDLHALVEYGRPFLNMRKAVREWAEWVVAGLA